MATDVKREKEREEVHRAIWAIADELRGAVDGWDFKNYVLGTMFYRYISENLAAYINAGEHAAGDTSFDYARLPDEAALEARDDLVQEKGFFILPSELFCNVLAKAAKGETWEVEEEDPATHEKKKKVIYLNEKLEQIFRNIVESAKGSVSESSFEGLFDDFDVNSNKLGSTVQKSTDITDDIVFEIELIKQIEINIDYILMLVKKYHDSHCEDKEVLVDIRKAVDASPELRSKKQLIENFINGINEVEDVMGEWNEFVDQQREEELAQIIADEKLKPQETRDFIETAFRDGEVKTTGTDIDKIMPPVSRFGGSGRAAKKQTVIEKLKAFFEKYFGIGTMFKSKKTDDEEA